MVVQGEEEEDELVHVAPVDCAAAQEIGNDQIQP